MSTDASGDGQRFFHATTARAAEEILVTGFRDAEGYYGSPMLLRGVFLSEWPLDEGDGRSTALFEIWVPRVIDMSDYELVEDGKPHREWCVPASLINERAEWRQVGDKEADEMRLRGFVPENWPDRCPDCDGVFQLVDEDVFDTDVLIGQCPDCGFRSLRHKH